MVSPVPSSMYQSASRLVCGPLTTGRYRRLGLFSSSYRLKLVGKGDFEYEPREKEEEGEEKEEPGDPTSRSFDNLDPSRPFAISTCTARYRRYIPVRQVTGMRTVRYWAIPPKIDRRRLIGGEIDRRRSIEGEKGKKKKKKRRKERSTSFPRAVLARALSPPTGHLRAVAALARG
ncbi:hypothetical protein B296_00012429 [Ensete ventricosum]|uniref:Uncharacterized protein n=1 Tax=Ensete ventricosum TaxID=4639 RepID=A0A427AV15_ENSVE|nr:hypothetical protein B296_00012429 [Ensete ventricosum]